ncbi:MAG: hypothetical protein ACOYK9_00025 [Chlamydiia bacterium]
MRQPNVLLITSSGGSGHLIAAKAIKDQLESGENPKIVLEQDVSKDWLGSFFGQLFISIWNTSQINGWIFMQEFLSFIHPLTYIFFTPSIFFHCFRLLMNYDFERVIDDQVLGTKAITNAVRLYNWLKKKDLKVEKVLTDLPTDYTLHFFSEIKTLNRFERTSIEIYAQPPLLYGELPEIFWKRKTGLPIEQIHIVEPPLRAAFSSPPIDNNLPLELDLCIDSEAAKQRLIKASQIHMQPPLFIDEKARLLIQPEDLVFTVMLGSHPSKGALFDYIEGFFRLVSQKEGPIVHIFILSQTGKWIEKGLVDDIVSQIISHPLAPKRLRFYPISKQNDQVVSKLFNRSNATITRSSGITTMELMKSSKGEIWIHQETPRSILGMRHHGMVIWEYGNALYLNQKRGARFVSPQFFEQAFQHYFKEQRQVIVPMTESISYNFN